MSKKGKGIGISEAIYLTVVSIFRTNRDGLPLGDIVKLVSEELEHKFIIGRQAVIKAIRRLESSAMVKWFRGFIKPTEEFFASETNEWLENFLKPSYRQRYRHVMPVAA